MHKGKVSPCEPARGDLSLRVHVVDSEATVAVRIAAAPLHRRAYRVASRPGALHPPLARALALLAGLRSGLSLVDPFCGTGTIPIEAEAVPSFATLAGGVTSSAPALTLTASLKATRGLRPVQMMLFSCSIAMATEWAVISHVRPVARWPASV